MVYWTDSLQVAEEIKSWLNEWLYMQTDNVSKVAKRVTRKVKSSMIYFKAYQ